MWADYLAAVHAQYGGTQQDFAKAIGVSRSTLSHMLSGEPHYASPSVELCLRIAAVTHTSPSRLLREAGKGPIAELLERLYGAPTPIRPRTVSPADLRILTALHRLDKPTFRAIVHLITALAAALT